MNLLKTILLHFFVCGIFSVAYISSAADTQSKDSRARIRTACLLRQLNPELDVSSEMTPSLENYHEHMRIKKQYDTRYLEDVAGNPSQSEGYQSVVDKELVESKLGLSTEKYQWLLNQVIAEEKKHPDMYAFYHGMSYQWIIFQDFLVALWKLKNGVVEDPDWYPLRMEDDLYSGTETMVEYLADNKGSINDTRLPYQKDLLSTNLSIPGKVVPLASSLYYFANSFNTEKNKALGLLDAYFGSSVSDKTLKGIIASYFFMMLSSISARFRERPEGALLQIFIAKDLADSVAYPSYSMGYPYTKHFMNEGWSSQLKMYTSVSPFCEKLQREPHFLVASKQMYYIQARILLRAEYFSSPHPKVFIKRYLSLSSDEEKEYKKEIEEFAVMFDRLGSQNNSIAIESIIDSGVERLSHEDSVIRGNAFVLLIELVKQGYAIEQSKETIEGLLFDPLVRKEVLYLFVALAEQGYLLEEALGHVFEATRNEDLGIRCVGLHLLPRFVALGVGLDEALLATTEAINSDSPAQIRFGINLIKTLIEDGYTERDVVDVAIKAMFIGRSSGAEKSRDVAFKLLDLLIACPDALPGLIVEAYRQNDKDVISLIKQQGGISRASDWYYWVKSKL